MYRSNERVKFLGERTVARDRAAGKSATEVNQARAKAESDLALNTPAEYMDQQELTPEQNYANLQPNTAATDAQTSPYM